MHRLTKKLVRQKSNTKHHTSRLIFNSKRSQDSRNIMFSFNKLTQVLFFMAVAQQYWYSSVVVNGQEFGPCNEETGICIDVDARKCNAPTLSGFCPGPANIRCCPEPGGIIQNACVAKGGLCKNEDNCFFGTTEAGLCPGPASVKCCIPQTTTDILRLLETVEVLDEKVDVIEDVALDIFSNTQKSTKSKSKSKVRG